MGKRLSYILFAILCLIPGAGAVIGFALVVYGLLANKDRLVVIIGSFGMLFSVSIYCFLEYDYKFGKATTGRLVTLTKMELTDLVKKIEIYKTSNGGYPGSLEELGNEYGRAIVVDPFLVRKTGDGVNVYFSYRKVGENYILFSVGVDGLPHTPDDIYPDTLGLGKMKIGLIGR